MNKLSQSYNEISLRHEKGQLQTPEINSSDVEQKEPTAEYIPYGPIYTQAKLTCDIGSQNGDHSHGGGSSKDGEPHTAVYSPRRSRRRTSAILCTFLFASHFDKKGRQWVSHP